MKRRTVRVTVGGALAGLWIAFLGLLLMTSAACPDNQVFCVVENAR
jgi:hypothetical protein